MYLHNSHDHLYREPAGPAKAGENVIFRFRADAAEEVVLRTWMGEERGFPMERAWFHSSNKSDEDLAFVAGLGMSLMAESFDEAARFADRIVYDGKTGARLIEAQRTHMLPEGSERIAQYIIERIGAE